MPASELRLIKRSAEFIPKKAVKSVPQYTRGVYVLFDHNVETDDYNVVYVGMTGTGVRYRLLSHSKSRKKAGKWTHFSFFEVWPNIGDDEIRELEGLFRHIYRKDAKANSLNKQGSYGKLMRARDKDLEETLAPSVTLKGWRDGWEHIATLRRDGTVQYGDLVYESPTAACRDAVGGRSRASSFWHYRDNKGEWLPLRTLR